MLDFGLVLLDRWDGAASELTTIGQFLGTLDYMAPEQAERCGTVDYRADLYSLGAVAYEMLTGRAPFTARTTQAMRAAHVIEVPEDIGKRRPATPIALATLIMRCLEKRPADRPQTAKEVIEALDAIQLSSGDASTSRASDRRAARSLPSVRSRVLAAVVIFALLAVGALWYFRVKPEVSARPVSNRVRLLELPEDVLWMLARGDLTEGHARAVLALPDDDARRRLARRISEDGLTVRAAERAAREGGAKRRRTSQAVDPALAERARNAAHRLTGLETRINAGKLELHFGSEIGLAELVETLEAL